MTIGATTSKTPSKFGITCLALALLTLSYGFVVFRMTKDMVIEGQPVLSKEAGLNGLADFRDAVYWPGKAFAAGTNPYNTPQYMQTFPVGNNFPLFSPLIMVLYGPLSALPFPIAAAIYVGINTILFGLLIALCLKLTRGEVELAAFGFVGAIVFLTQPGRACFHGGQLAALLALLSLLTLSQSRFRPWLAGLALALSSIKPTFGIPLGIFLFAQRRWNALRIGWGIGAVIGIVGLIVIFSQREGLRAMPSILLQNQAYLNADPDVDPRTTHVRIDSEVIALRLIPRLIGQSWAMIIPLGITSLVATWLVGNRNCPPSSTTATSLGFQLGIEEVFGLLTIALSMYHLIYDALILLPAVCALAFSVRIREELANSVRIPLLVLTCIPFVNVLWSPSVVNFAAKLELPILDAWTNRQGFVWEAISMSNPVAVFVAWVLVVLHLAVTRSDALPAPGTA